MIRSLIIFLVLAISAGPVLAEHTGQQNGASAESHGRFQHTNRLIDSRDPYLLLHAHNPVDWYPWGPEALARSKRENRPIFLSIGYSTCYWCHVAERTIYSDPGIARLMNQWFVNIKVDREQRPDLDGVYMLATELMTRAGGWPNNLFLTPDLKPFFGGSYFPPEEFSKLLVSINGAWSTKRAEIIARADKVAMAMRQAKEELAKSKETDLSPKALLAQDVNFFLRRLDKDYGGFQSGPGPKFPQEPVITLMLADYREHHNLQVRNWLESTLDAMAYGGIWDHLGNGFHRYSTEPTWSIPHFEKMLYDNSELLKIYAQAYQETSKPLYRQVAVGIGDYLAFQMMEPKGGFFTAQDAEVNGVEGASYVWTDKQIDKVLGKADEAKFFQVYQLATIPNRIPEETSAEERPGVIRIRLPIANTLVRTRSKQVTDMLSSVAVLRQKLLLARNQRPQPATDEKIVVGINGLAIEALAVSARILKKNQYLASARLTSDRIWTLAYDPKTGTLQHEIFRGQAQTSAYLEDYALLGNGYMALYDSTGAAVWKQRASLLADSMLHRFAHDNGALTSSPDLKDLLVPAEDTGDDVYPSGTSAAITLLMRLAAATGDQRYAATESRVVRHLSGQLHDNPEGWPVAVTALNARPPLLMETRLASHPVGINYDRNSRHGTAVSTIPDSALHVRATAAAEAAAPGSDKGEIYVTLEIERGYHVNANPSSLDYLIPTSVAFDALSPEQIRYPKPVCFNASFSKQALNIYEGTVTITASFPKGILKDGQVVRGKVTAQACTDRLCLSPSSLPISVTVENHEITGKSNVRK